jgi:hypothetical protein
MSRRDTGTKPPLPVTDEVGGEGGSFADRTIQVSTEAGRLDRTRSTGDAQTASRPVRSESVSANTDEDVKEGTVKYPNEE